MQSEGYQASCSAVGFTQWKKPVTHSLSVSSVLTDHLEWCVSSRIASYQALQVRQHLCSNMLNTVMKFCSIQRLLYPLDNGLRQMITDDYRELLPAWHLTYFVVWDNPTNTFRLCFWRCCPLCQRSAGVHGALPGIG